MLYRRFFSVSREFSDNATEYFVDIDFINHVSLMAVANNAGQATIVGGGRYVVFQPIKPKSRSIVDAYLRPTQTTGRYPQEEVNRIRRWIGCSGRAFIGNDTLKRSMSPSATAAGAANTFHSTTSEHGGVVSEPS